MDPHGSAARGPLVRVALVTGEYPPDEGGVADYTRCLADALVEQGCVVDVLTTRHGPAETAVDGRRVTVYRAIGRWDWRALGALGRFVAATGPDVVHVQYQAAAYAMHPAIDFAPGWLGRRTPVLTAGTYHDLLVPYLFPKAGPLRRWVVRRPARDADLILTTNAEDHARVALWRPRGRHQLVPIGSNVPDAPPEGYERAAFRARAGFPEAAAILAYFGFLNQSKGGRVLLEALERLRADGRDARLVMIGGRVGASDPTNAGYLAAFEAEAAGRGLAEAIRWTGHLAPPQVSAWLRAADVAVLPYADGASYRRGSLLAALTHGLPVVTTTPAPTGGALPALREGESARLVAPGDVAALAAAVAGVLDDPALAARLGRGAREVAAHFGWDAIAARHAALYRAALAARRPA